MSRLIPSKPETSKFTAPEPQEEIEEVTKIEEDESTQRRSAIDILKARKGRASTMLSGIQRQLKKRLGE